MGSQWFENLIEGARLDELPAHPETSRALAAVLADERCPLRRISEVVLGDPALAVRVLQAANRVERRYEGREIVTLEEAIHLLGTRRLSQIVSEMPIDEDRLAGDRLVHYRRSCGRAWLAALLAQDWAELDRDRVPSEVALASLLNPLGELYWLVHGDARIQRYLEMMAHVGVFAHEAEYVTLGENLEWLGYRLAVQWGLPEMVRESMRARNAAYPRPLYVMLAQQIARLALGGWSCPGAWGDLELAAELLGLKTPDLGFRIDRVLERFNRSAHRYGIEALTPLPDLALGPGSAASEASCTSPFCLAPRADEFQRAYQSLSAAGGDDPEALIRTWLEGLQRGLGLNRAVYAVYDPQEEVLRPEQAIGTDFEPRFNRFDLRLAEGGIFARLIESPGAIWFDEGRAGPDAWLPTAVRLLTGVGSFFARSLWAGGRPLGLIYADRRFASCALDARAYRGFIALSELAESALARLVLRSKAGGCAPAQGSRARSGDRDGDPWSPRPGRWPTPPGS